MAVVAIFTGDCGFNRDVLSGTGCSGRLCAGPVALACPVAGAGPIRTFFTISLPSAFPGLIASGIFVFLESLDEFTGTYFVGAPEITTLPMLMFRAGMEGNYQIASITALLLLVPSVLFMFVVERFLKADVLRMTRPCQIRLSW